MKQFHDHKFVPTKPGIYYGRHKSSGSMVFTHLDEVEGSLPFLKATSVTALPLPEATDVSCDTVMDPAFWMWGPEFEPISFNLNKPEA